MEKACAQFYISICALLYWADNSLQTLTKFPVVRNDIYIYIHTYTHTYTYIYSLEKTSTFNVIIYEHMHIFFLLNMS